MLISFVIPTRNRTHDLGYTLGQFQHLDLDDLGGDTEVIVVDNDSDSSATISRTLGNGIRVNHVQLNENIGTGARNIGAQSAHGEWIIMLDDDSNLIGGEVGAYLSGLDPATAAVGGEIFLPSGLHESGGLPEVIIGCGCAIRREAFLEVGGYDGSFGFYAEEYDLCARFIASGYRVRHTRAIRFEHRKCEVGRNFDEILYRLVRNNGWVLARYAPQACRQAMIDQMISRYEQIAIKENAIAGFDRGRIDLGRTIEEQTQTPLSEAHWERFIGDESLQSGLIRELGSIPPTDVCMVGAKLGKGRVQVRKGIESCGHRLSMGEPSGDLVQVIATLSPGPMLDAKEAFPEAICPWKLEESAKNELHI